MTIDPHSQSYPYLALAQAHGWDYGEVLRVAQFLENNPEALGYWLGIVTDGFSFLSSSLGKFCSSDLWIETARRVSAEHQRRVPILISPAGGQ